MTKAFRFWLKTALPSLKEHRDGFENRTNDDQNGDKRNWREKQNIDAKSLNVPVSWNTRHTQTAEKNSISLQKLHFDFKQL